MQTDEVEYELELRTLGLVAFPEKMQEFWAKAHNDLGMELLCSCSCDAVLSGQQFYNSYNYLLPELCIGNVLDYNCEELTEIVNLECKYNNLESLHNYIKVLYNELQDSNLITIQEIQLLERIILNTKNGIYNFSQIENEFLELPKSNITNNSITLITIEGLKSVTNYINARNSNPVFANEPQAIILHLMAGVSGGLANVLYKCIKDTIKDNGYDGNGVKNDMIDGFIVGAVMAI